MQTLADLAAHFAIPGGLAFDQAPGGLLRLRATTPACTAELYLQGAHLTQWQPSGQAPVLFLSDRSEFAPGKPIRGGVPIVFPWFAARSATPESPRTDGPSHGFARIETWTLAFAALSGNDLHLTFTLPPSEQAKSLGYEHFRLAFELILGRSLTMRLTAANDTAAPMPVGEALHTYFAVGNPEHIRITGLGGTEYLDKPDHSARKRQTEPVLTLHGETDRPYLNTAATVTLDDPDLHRRITVAKKNSLTTVVWNPWATRCATIPDLPADAWRHYTCIETANAAENTLSLPPKTSHTMESHITVTRL